MTAERIGINGLCDDYTPHEAHVFWWERLIDNAGNRVLWSCPGQHVDCRNCDDRKCMGCVLREWDHNCADDCPMCCAGSAA